MVKAGADTSLHGQLTIKHNADVADSVVGLTTVAPISRDGLPVSVD